MFDGDAGTTGRVTLFRPDFDELDPVREEKPENEDGSADVDLRENLGGLNLERFDFEVEDMNSGIGSELFEVADGATGLAPNNADFTEELIGLDGGGMDEANSGGDEGVFGVGARFGASERIGVVERLELLAEK